MPHCVKVRPSKQTGFMDYASRCDALLALISRGQFYAPTYLWLEQSLHTPKLNSKDLLSSVRVTSSLL